MIALEKWDDGAFIKLMRDAIHESPVEDDEPVNLAAERHNPVISMEEFAGNFN